MTPVIAGLAAAGIASSLAGSILGANASSEAASKAAEQERQALEYQKKMYEDSVKRMSPYTEAGVSQLGKYQTALENQKQQDFGYKVPEFNFSTYEDPGANYQMQRAQRALNSSSLSRGSAGGGFSKAIAEKQQELAGTAYKDSFGRYIDTTKLKYGEATDKYNRDYGYQQDLQNRRQGLITGGLTAAGGLGTLGSQTGQQVGQSYGQVGSSLASGTIGSSNALMSGLGNATNQLGQAYGMYLADKNKTPWTPQSNTNLGG